MPSLPWRWEGKIKRKESKTMNKLAEGLKLIKEHYKESYSIKPNVRITCHTISNPQLSYDLAKCITEQDAHVIGETPTDNPQKECATWRVSNIDVSLSVFYPPEEAKKEAI